LIQYGKTNDLCIKLTKIATTNNVKDLDIVMSNDKTAKKLLDKFFNILVIYFGQNLN